MPLVKVQKSTKPVKHFINRMLHAKESLHSVTVSFREVHIFAGTQKISDAGTASRKTGDDG
jgi:hypothetical protein